MSTGRPLALLDEAMVKKVEAPNPRNSFHCRRSAKRCTSRP